MPNPRGINQYTKNGGGGAKKPYNPRDPSTFPVHQVKAPSAADAARRAAAAKANANLMKTLASGGLPAGYTRKGSSVVSPTGVVTYAPLRKPGPPKPVTSQKRLKSIFNNKYN